jgi:uncharacterized RDD family membrane protein YckC
MRCPACGFISFDDLLTCKQCGVEFPQRGKVQGIVTTMRLAGLAPTQTSEPVTPEAGRHDAKVVSAVVPPEASVGAATPADPASLPKGGFWLRSVAFLADVGLVAALAVAGGILVGGAVQIGGVFSSAPQADLDWLEWVAKTLFSMVIDVCYFTLFVGWRGQTPGKMLLGLKIIRVSGEEVGYARALLRRFGQGLGAVLFGIGLLMVAFSRRKQGLHDKLAGTYVIRLPS